MYQGLQGGTKIQKTTRGRFFFLKSGGPPHPPTSTKNGYVRPKMVITRNIITSNHDAVQMYTSMYIIYTNTIPVMHAFVGASRGSHWASLSVCSQSLSILNET